jgi:hypothetical protein
MGVIVYLILLHPLEVEVVVPQVVLVLLVAQVVVVVPQVLPVVLETHQIQLPTKVSVVVLVVLIILAIVVVEEEEEPVRLVKPATQTLLVMVEMGVMALHLQLLARLHIMQVVEAVELSIKHLVLVVWEVVELVDLLTPVLMEQMDLEEEEEGLVVPIKVEMVEMELLLLDT